MKLFRITIIFVTQLTIASACWAFDKHMIKEECKAKWGDDYSMQLYCVEQNTTAGQHVDKIHYAHSKDTTESNILAKCLDEWPKDYTMVVYCYDQQLSAFKALQ